MNAGKVITQARTMVTTLETEVTERGEVFDAAYVAYVGLKHLIRMLQGFTCDFEGCPGDHPTPDNYCSFQRRYGAPPMFEE